MRRNQSAFFLITALVVLTSMVALGLASLTRSTTELYGSGRFVTDQQAFQLAETAVDAVLRNLQAGQFDHLVIAPMAGGTYWATVDPAGASRFVINAHGLRTTEQRDIESVVSISPRSVFQFSLFGSEQLIVSGEAITDSYDSNLGAYDANAPGQHGDVGTNSTTAGGVTISGSIAINGQVAVGSEVADPNTIVVVSGGTALITGTPPVASQETLLAMPPLTVPEGLSCTDLTVTGQTTLLLPSALGQHCFHNLSVSGGATLTADGPVKIYVTGAFAASGNTVIGIPTNPDAMLLFLVSDQQATIDSSLTGSTEFYGGLYAPSARIEIDGNAQVFGSVTARVVSVSGNAQVHYDEALGRLTEPVGGYDTELLSWREP